MRSLLTVNQLNNCLHHLKNNGELACLMLVQRSCVKTFKHFIDVTHLSSLDLYIYIVSKASDTDHSLKTKVEWVLDNWLNGCISNALTITAPFNSCLGFRRSL